MALLFPMHCGRYVTPEHSRALQHMPQNQSSPSYPAFSSSGAAAQLIAGNHSLFVTTKILTMTKDFHMNLGAFSVLRSAEFPCNDSSVAEAF